jgi:cobalt-zinc-cadmium efflux system outer membrane protein
LRKASGPLALAVFVTTVTVSAVFAEGPDLQPYILTLDGARELARAQSPRLLAARARVEVARGEQVGASVWQPTNPELSVAAGPRRRGDIETDTDVEVEIGQRFQLGGRRHARVDRAGAGIVRAGWTAQEEERGVLREVSRSFLATLHAERSIEVARESERVARELRETTERRFEAGDVGVLDPHAATTAHARSRIRLAEAEAMRALAVGELRAMLGLEDDADIVAEGDLGDRGRYALDALIERAAGRADLGEIEAAITEARAQQELGKAHRAPDLGAFARYSREEGAEIVQGGLSITLPFIQRGQGRSAVAEAEARALELELQAARAVVKDEVRARFEVFSILDSAAAQFGSETLPSLDRMLDLARKSYEAGNSPFAELLVLQREVVEVRQAYLDLLLRAALAGTELEAAAGVL